MHTINKRGQSTVEYVLLVAAVIAVMIAFSTNSNTGVQKQLNKTLDDATSQMTELSGRMSASQQGSDGNWPPSSAGVTAVDPTQAISNN